MFQSIILQKKKVETICKAEIEPQIQREKRMDTKREKWGWDKLGDWD